MFTMALKGVANRLSAKIDRGNLMNRNLAKSGSRHRVLVLAEENENGDFLSFLLNAGGFGVTVSRSSDETMRSLLRGQPEAVVVDLASKTGNNSLKIEFIRKGWPGIPIITLVPPECLQLGEESVKSGATGYLTKPLDFSEMKGLLQEALFQSGPTHQI